jgi:exodeoxyribonuclease-3
VKILTWNVNGIRAIHKKGFLPWIRESKPDVLCLQEIKARPEQLEAELREVAGYEAFFTPAKRPGYSGTAIYTRIKPDEAWAGLGEDRFDDEGRVTAVRFGKLHVLSAYFPNAQEAGARLSYKVAFCDRITDHLKDLVAKGHDVVLTGDYNIAHQEIDLARPDDNHENPGFLPDERKAMTKFLAAGFHDVFREKYPSREGAYTWWSYRTNARARNIGWRIDYTNVNARLSDRVKKAWIDPDTHGSDHCPVGLVLGD